MSTPGLPLGDESDAIAELRCRVGELEAENAELRGLCELAISQRDKAQRDLNIARLSMDS